MQYAECDLVAFSGGAQARMSQSTIQIWSWLHKWSSLVCTLFLLMLCVTGLPLIFHHEIEHLTGEEYVMPDLPGDDGLESLDTVLAEALASRPGEVGLFMSFDEDRPVVNVTSGPAYDAPERQMTLMSLDWRSADFVPPPVEEGIMAVILQLHIDMFLGLPGKFFLGAMGALFVVAIVSGVVLYAPFMRKHDFGTLRVSRSRRVKWLDWHNLLGIVTLAWASVVGLTGVINAFSEPITATWQATQLGEMTAGYREAEPPAELGSIQGAIDAVTTAAPGMRVQFVAFPGGLYSTDHHYAVFLQGATPLTKRLLTVGLVDAVTGELTDIRPMPWYMQALLLSQPLHFGDYGGLPMKILWALLDLVTIVVLGSGVYLWLARRKRPVRTLMAEAEA